MLVNLIFFFFGELICSELNVVNLFVVNLIASHEKIAFKTLLSPTGYIGVCSEVSSWSYWLLIFKIATKITL